MYQTIANRSPRGFDEVDSPQLKRREIPSDQEREQLCLVELPADAAKDADQEVERVLAGLQEKPTDLERYIYLIRLYDRNKTLCYKVLMSDPIRFLLPLDYRRNLLESFSIVVVPTGYANLVPRKGRGRALAPNAFAS
jgi:malate dehydrogenase (oxaloacetate-decarboxylating)(NADP+)